MPPDTRDTPARPDGLNGHDVGERLLPGAQATRAGPVRLGVSGCGRLLELGYLPAIERMPRVELVGIVDPHAGRRERIAEIAATKTGCRPQTFASDDSLLGALPIDVMVIANPTADHLASASAAVAAAVPVLVEKPPARDLEGARCLAELPSRVWLGFNRRFGPARDLVHKIPADGFLRVDLSLSYRRGSWRAHTVHDEALLDLGPHMIDLGLVLTRSAPIAVTAQLIEADQMKIEVQTTRAVLQIRGSADRGHRESIAVRDGTGRRIAAARTGGAGGHVRRLASRPHPLVTSLLRQLDQVCAALDGDKPVGLADATCGIPVMLVIDAARDSWRRGGVVVPLQGRAVGEQARSADRAQRDFVHALTT